MISLGAPWLSHLMHGLSSLDTLTTHTHTRFPVAGALLEGSRAESLTIGSFDRAKEEGQEAQGRGESLRMSERQEQSRG